MKAKTTYISYSKATTLLTDTSTHTKHYDKKVSTWWWQVSDSAKEKAKIAILTAFVLGITPLIAFMLYVALTCNL